MAEKYLIIGGSTGITAALAGQLLQDGQEVYLRSRNRPEWDGAEKAHWMSWDAASGEEIPELPQELNGLVYGPGTINLKPFRGLKPGDWENDWKVNVMGAVQALQQCEKALKSATHASVVLFSTVAVQTGMPFHASVAAAKGAIEGLTRSLAAEWAPKIRVNAIAPSLTDTPMASRLLSSEDKLEASKQRHPLKRIASAEEIGALTRFLLQPGQASISGQVWFADNGMHTLKSL